MKKTHCKHGHEMTPENTYKRPARGDTECLACRKASKVKSRPQAEPTIAKAINGGYDLLEAKCNRCDRVSLVALRALKHPPDTPVWKLEAALYCEPCSECRHYSRRQRAHILGLTYARPEPEPSSATALRKRAR
jgi:hypothetical protein